MSTAINNKKRVVVLGGGTGLSCLLNGLKLFPIDVTTVIAVSDNGSSTGVLKEELDIPAVGDVGKVLLSMANVDDDFIELLQYRFKNDGSLHNHPVRNILLAALIATKGNITEATKYMCRLLNVSGTVLPLTEEKVDLIGIGHDEREYFGEEEVSRNISNIDRLKYDHEIHVNDELLDKLREADMIIFSPGSLYTSIIPHLLSEDVLYAIFKSNAPIMYVSNLVTQPGETDGYSVSDHVRVLNKYLDERHVDMVVANNSVIDENIMDKYIKDEDKHRVLLDEEELKRMRVSVVADDILSLEDGKIRHDALKTAYLIFSILMKL